MNASSLSSVFSVLNDSLGHLHFSHVSADWLPFLITAGSKKPWIQSTPFYFQSLNIHSKEKNSQFTMMPTDKFYDPKICGAPPEIILVITGN